MQDPSEALAELDRVKTLRGIRGIYVGTNINNRNVIGAGTRLSRFYLNNFLGNPFDTAIAAAHLVFGGVLDRFPKLEVCLPHAGGVTPYLMGRLSRTTPSRTRRTCCAFSSTRSAPIA